MNGVMEEVLELEIQPQDIFVASFPKSGTTWLQQVVYLLLNRDENEGKALFIKPCKKFKNS